MRHDLCFFFDILNEINTFRNERHYSDHDINFQFTYYANYLATAAEGNNWDPS